MATKKQPLYKGGPFLFRDKSMDFSQCFAKVQKTVPSIHEDLRLELVKMTSSSMGEIQKFGSQFLLVGLNQPNWKILVKMGIFPK